MKQILYLSLIALCSIFTLGSCDDDDDTVNVPEAVQAAFKTRFPDAERAEWEIKVGFYVAEFHAQGAEIEAWFDKDAQWCMTDTDFGRNISSIPAAVQSALAESEYSTWNIDDINKYERKDMTFYVIEVETKGQKEHHLFYGETGNLIKDMVKNGNDNIYPFTPVP